jgi:hypothetical protein
MLVCRAPLQVKHMRAAYDSKVSFVLMNSFSTSEDTRAFLAASPHADLLQASARERALQQAPCAARENHPVRCVAMPWIMQSSLQHSPSPSAAQLGWSHLAYDI